MKRLFLLVLSLFLVACSSRLQSEPDFLPTPIALTNLENRQEIPGSQGQLFIQYQLLPQGDWKVSISDAAGKALPLERIRDYTTSYDFSWRGQSYVIERGLIYESGNSCPAESNRVKIHFAPDSSLKLEDARIIQSRDGWTILNRSYSRGIRSVSSAPHWKYVENPFASSSEEFSRSAYFRTGFSAQDLGSLKNLPDFGSFFTALKIMNFSNQGELESEGGRWFSAYGKTVKIAQSYCQLSPDYSASRLSLGLELLKNDRSVFSSFQGKDGPIFLCWGKKLTLRQEEMKHAVLLVHPLNGEHLIFLGNAADLEALFAAFGVILKLQENSR